MAPQTSSVREIDLDAGALHLLAKRFYTSGPAMLRTFQHWRPYICPFEKLIVHVPRNSTVLDIGCGSGLFLTFLAAAGRCRKGVGVDSSQPAIELAKRAAANLAKSGHNSDVAFLCQDARQELPAGPFDVVSIVDVMHHVPPAAVDSVIGAAAARLGPGGILVYKDMRAEPLWRALANRLHDLVIARQWIHYCPIEKVERAAGSAGLKLCHGSEFDRLWYAHQLRVFQRS